ncbi:MAG: tyrosine-protein phosphatase [Desulfobacterales bacterium]
MIHGESPPPLHPAGVRRLNRDAVEVYWNGAGAGGPVSVFRGHSPVAIDGAVPVARLERGDRIVLPAPEAAGPHFFRLESGNGAKALCGERRPFIEGAPNFRDLGGYETAAGRRVRWGLLFRSSHLGRLTERGREQILRLGIRTVCDFRTAAEAEKMPARFPRAGEAQLVHLPIQHGEFEPTAVYARILRGDVDWLSEEFMLEGYIASLEQDPGLWRRFFALAASSGDRPLLFHCTGGKDRTGAAAALLLLALGVPEETVIADYGLSDGYNAEVRQAMFAQLETLGIDPERVAPYFTAPESRIRALLSYIAGKYGSAWGYLTSRAGVPQETIARLREELLE